MPSLLENRPADVANLFPDTPAGRQQMADSIRQMQKLNQGKTPPRMDPRVIQLSREIQVYIFNIGPRKHTLENMGSLGAWNVLRPALTNEQYHALDGPRQRGYVRFRTISGALLSPFRAFRGSRYGGKATKEKRSSTATRTRKTPDLNSHSRSSVSAGTSRAAHRSKSSAYSSLGPIRRSRKRWQKRRRNSARTFRPRSTRPMRPIRSASSSAPAGSLNLTIGKRPARSARPKQSARGWTR